MSIREIPSEKMEEECHVFRSEKKKCRKLRRGEQRRRRKKEENEKKKFSFEEYAKQFIDEREKLKG